MKIMLKITYKVFLLCLSFFTINLQAQLISGEQLYMDNCAGCHGKALEGATGFNLKDTIWVHGKEPKDILNNISKGFPKKGMPAFGQLYSQAQLNNVVDFILSNKEGIEGLHYKLYQMESAEDRELSPKKLIKQGELGNNLAAFDLPEIQNYALVFEGELHVPYPQDVLLFADSHKNIYLDLELNGEKQPRINEWQPHWLIKSKKTPIKLTYFYGDTKPWFHNVPLFIINKSNKIKLFPLSTRGKTIMDDQKVYVLAKNKTEVSRKRILNLPSKSVAVGLTSKLNYAFNTRSCRIVGLWQGDFLNIGPNIHGRGQTPSVPLGDWIFHSPQTLSHHSTEACDFIEINRLGEPMFSYLIDNVNYTVTASSESNHTLLLNYTSTNTTDDITFNLPKHPRLTVISKQGYINSNILVIPSEHAANFSIALVLNEEDNHDK